MLERRLAREILVVSAYLLALIGCVSIGKGLSSRDIMLAGGLLAGLLLSGGFLLALERINRRKMLDDRPALSSGELYARYYACSAIPRLDFEHAWTEITRILAVDPRKCRPEDTLCSLFALPDWLAPWHWGDPGRLLALATARAPSQASRETLDDIVRALALPASAPAGEELVEAA